MENGRARKIVNGVARRGDVEVACRNQRRPYRALRFHMSIFHGLKPVAIRRRPYGTEKQCNFKTYASG